MNNLQQFRERFDPWLEQYVETKLSACEALIDDEGIHAMLQYARELIFRGGKRIRPYLTSVGYRARGQSEEMALQAGIALELFHVFALIHDDVMDQGKSRHGIPTAHVSVAEHLRQQGRVGDIERIGESQAILLGDLLLSWANEAMAVHLAETSLDRLSAARSFFYRMQEEVVMGQMVDVDLMTRREAPLALINQKMRLKTGSYTFIRPMQIGAALTGAPEEDISSYWKIGDPLGVAFQIQDDLFDLMSTPKEVKKTVFSDLTDRQHTVFTDYIFTHGTDEEREELSSLLGAPLTEQDRPRVTRLFIESGAMAEGEKYMESCFDAAMNALTVSSLPDHTKVELGALMEYLRNRAL